MATEIILKHDGGMRFDAAMPDGHTLRLDTNVDSGGTGSGPSPIQTLLASLGGCGAMDVISILQKMRQDVTAYEIRLTGERATEHPKVYTRISVIHVVRGKGVQEANVRRAIELSISRYCPVHAMLAPAVAITDGYEIYEGDAPTPLAVGVVSASQAAPGS